jgi:Uncharacterized conserved protein
MCGLPKCPISSRFHALQDTRPVSEYMGASPSVFVGSYGYPRVVGGPLMINDSDNPLDWIKKGFSIDDIVSVRSRTIRGGKDIDVHVPDLGKVQEIALSSKPLDVEVSFEKPVLFDLNFDGEVTPTGLSGQMKKLDVIDNASVSRIVDKCTSDTDLRASEAARVMFENGTDIYKITNLLTSGLMGLEKNRRVVPTRWAITAADSMLADSYKHEIVRYPSIADYEVYCGMLHGNRICFILIPANDWRFEMLERWQRHSLWGGEEESILVDGEKGMTKSEYSPIAGGYYAARLAALEHLHNIGRCARIICIRDITSDYWAPLGVWVVREASHASLSSRPVKVGTLAEALAAASQLLGTSFWIPRMGLVKEMREQKTLFDF